MRSILRSILLALAAVLVVLAAAAGLYIHAHRYVPPQARNDAPYQAPQPAPDDLSWHAYGGDPGQVFASIVQGRPNGMPTFANKLPDHQIWQLAAYVRSMGGLVPSDAAPGRADHMQSRPAENTIDPQSPKQAGTRSPATEMPQ